MRRTSCGRGVVHADLMLLSRRSSHHRDLASRLPNSRYTLGCHVLVTCWSRDNMTFFLGGPGNLQLGQKGGGLRWEGEEEPRSRRARASARHSPSCYRATHLQVRNLSRARGSTTSGPSSTLHLLVTRQQLTRRGPHRLSDKRRA